MFTDSWEWIRTDRDHSEKEKIQKGHCPIQSEMTCLCMQIVRKIIEGGDQI